MMNRNILHPMMFETYTPIGEGVYHSTELGLISLSVDGTTWYTIADKNLGASSLGGNGLYYQRGNNYGFGSGNYVWQQRVDATNYGPYYERGVFVSGGIIPGTAEDKDWAIVHNDNLRGGVTNTVEAKRGPCPEGFHIPSYDENHTLFDMVVALVSYSLHINRDEIVQRFLMMPYAGAIHFTYDEGSGSYTGGQYYVGEQGPYRSCTANGGSANLLGRGGMVSPDVRTAGKTRGLLIRPFKNTVEIPDGTWTTLYDRSDIAQGAGVFWNSADAIISISANGTDYLTIADKNLGATQIYQIDGLITQENSGGFFQRGNNYMFPRNSGYALDYAQVDASNYGPYYYSSDFIGTTSLSNTYNWSSVTNKNLWGGVTNTDIAKRGPCPEGFHIPTMLEESEFEHNLGTLGGSIGTIYMPNTGLMYPNMSVYDKSWRGVWTSQRVEGGDTPYFRGNFYRSYGAGRGMQIRPFKNAPVVPDSTRTKLL